MSFGSDGSTWITGILMALTVVVGLLGISRDHHRTDGKLTRVGWGLVAAILLLGVATFLSGLRDKRIADEKELADSTERGRQFQTQMRALRSVTGSLSELQAGMRESLGKQERLFGVANRNLSTSEALQQQTRQNTDSVLRRVFAESNRVAAERIAIAVTYRCPPGDRFTDAPRIREATLTVRDGSGPAVRLTTRQTTELGDGIIFHGFLGDLRHFETFPVWRAAQVSIRLSGGDDRIGTALADLVYATDEERRRMENPAEVTCPASAILLLNGRQVLRASGNLTKSETGFRAYAVDFGGLRVDNDRLPRFSN